MIQGRTFTGVIIDEIQGSRTTPMTPWQYLDEWQLSDNTKEMNTLEWINTEMQKRYPGEYRIVKRLDPKQFWEPHYHIVFDTPAIETFYRLKWL